MRAQQQLCHFHANEKSKSEINKTFIFTIVVFLYAATCVFIKINWTSPSCSCGATSADFFTGRVSPASRDFSWTRSGFSAHRTLRSADTKKEDYAETNGSPVFMSFHILVNVLQDVRVLFQIRYRSSRVVGDVLLRELQELVDEDERTTRPLEVLREDKVSG